MKRRSLFYSWVPPTIGAEAAAPDEGPSTGDFRQALVRADPRLSMFNPLPRILFHDDFDEGINGWTELQANHDGNLDNLRPVLRDMRPPQLSSCTFFDIGTHGSMNGTYALKLATRPRPFHASAAIKRVTFAKPGLVQFEMYFTFKAEQTFDAGNRRWDGNVSPSELDFGDFTISNDICEGDPGPRYICALKYWNTGLDGKPVRKWTYKTSLHTTTKMERSGLPTQTQDFHVRNVTDWADVPGGHQPLCFNETATKVNWHYLRWLFDTRERRNTELQVNELLLDLRKIPVPMYDHGYRALNHLLNFLVDVRTHRAVRNFLFIDSILVSVDW
ncbi:MAG: DUF6772 family protein [Acidobacteriota bacterium]